MLFGHGIGGKGKAAALALAVSMIASPALADTAPITAYYNPGIPGYTPPGPTQAVINVPVTATVGGSCGFATAPNGTITNSNIDTTGWTGQVAFMPQCTAPWRIAVSSANGALKNTATASSGYQNRAPYNVTLSIPYNTGSSSGTVTSTCAVKDLNATTTTASCDFDGAASTSNGLLVPRSFNLSGSYIQAAAPAYPGPDVLVAGTYTDTLTVTVSPAL